jgi:hypothetical protein
MELKRQELLGCLNPQGSMVGSSEADKPFCAHLKKSSSVPVQPQFSQTNNQVHKTWKGR